MARSGVASPAPGKGEGGWGPQGAVGGSTLSCALLAEPPSLSHVGQPQRPQSISRPRHLGVDVGLCREEAGREAIMPAQLSARGETLTVQRREPWPPSPGPDLKSEFCH